MACDIRLAGPGARFATTPAKLGISYPQEDVHRLVSLVGQGHAARLLFSATSIDGAEAVRIGLAELLSERPEETAAELARGISTNADQSLRTLKRSIALAARNILSDPEQDRTFDDLLGSEELWRRLDAHHSRSR
jgi:enoyl-CoA hydratase/carnithine racemase